MMPNARFKEWINGGWVTLTVRPGFELRWGKYYRTDEGWNSIAYTWRLDGGMIYRDWSSDGVDCDGRLSRAITDFSRIEDIANDQYVSWHTASAGQRDYAAEAAGY